MSEQQQLQFPHVAARLFNVPLAIEADKLRTIAYALSTRFGVELVGLPPMQPAPESLVVSGRTEQPQKPYQLVNGIAVIPIMGSLVHRSGWMDAMSGLTSYESIGKAFDAALADDEADSILLHIDSPGGEVSGLFDLGDKIFNAFTDKPIRAFGDGMVTSAAYLLASSAHEFFLSQAAIAGSIGVRMLHIDQSRANEARGLTVTEIVSGARKADGTPHAPLNEESFNSLLGRVNDMADLFIAAVARNRGLAQAAIRGTDAGVYIGQKAVGIRLADGVRTLEQMLSTPAATDSQATANIEREERSEADMEKIDTIAALAAAFPDLCKQMTGEAVAAERGRIKKILTLAPKGQEQLAQRLAFEADTAPGAAAEQFLEAQASTRQAGLDAFTKDAPQPVETMLSDDANNTPDHIKSAQAVNEWRQKKLVRVQ